MSVFVYDSWFLSSRLKRIRTSVYTFSILCTPWSSFVLSFFLYGNCLPDEQSKAAKLIETAATVQKRNIISWYTARFGERLLVAELREQFVNHDSTVLELFFERLRIFRKNARFLSLVSQVSGKLASLINSNCALVHDASALKQNVLFEAHTTAIFHCCFVFSYSQLSSGQES